MSNATQIDLQTETQAAANARFARACDQAARAEADFRAKQTDQSHALVVAARRALVTALGDRG